VSIAWSIASKRFGNPCTPRVSAGGTASRTMCAFGAIAYAHCTSSAASTAQPAAEPGPDCPFAFGFPFSSCGLPRGKTWSKFGSGRFGKNRSWNTCSSSAARGLP
jgi:hypothetical protein